MSEIQNTTNYIFLKCIKEGGKLRVKVTSDGYLKEANTQFPRDIRMVGRRFKVLAKDINLIKSRGKYFYSVKNREKITIISDDEDIDIVLCKDLSNIKIHTDEDSTECIICMDAQKDTVFDPCGHFYACKKCCLKVTKCPICRTLIKDRINITNFG